MSRVQWDDPTDGYPYEVTLPDGQKVEIQSRKHLLSIEWQVQIEELAKKKKLRRIIEADGRTRA